MRLAKPDDVRLRFVLLLALIAACQPFTGEGPQAQASDDTSAESPPKKTSTTKTDMPSTMPEPQAPAKTSACDGAFFCDDFEASDKGNGQWTGFESVGFDAILHTPPSAGPGMFSLGFLLLDGSDTHPSLRHDLGAHDHVELGFALRVPRSFGETGHVNIAHLDFGDSEVVLTVIGERDRVGLVTLDDKRDFQLVREVAVTPDTWHDVKLVVDLPGEPATSKLTIDGVDVVANDVLAIPFKEAPQVSLTIGPDFKSTSASFEVRYDDVRVDVQDL